MTQDRLTKVGFEAPFDLVEALQAARKAGRRYRNKGFSNRLAYVIGVKTLLGIEDEEEDEVIEQRLADLDIQETFINSQKKLLIEKKEQRQAQKKKKEKEILKNQEKIESLALMLKENWEPITIFKKRDNIRFILNAFPGKLSRENVESVFPDEGVPVPADEDFLLIATYLLKGGCDE